MAKEAHAEQGGVVTPMSPQKRGAQTRKSPQSIEVFAVIQILDEAGNPQPVRKGSVRVVSFERNGIAVLNKVDDQENYQHATYLRGLLPPGR